MPLARRLPALFLAASSVMISACATYERKSDAVANTLAAGQYAAAAQAAKAGVEDASDNDKLVWKLEYAACERAAGNWEASAKAFDSAEADLRKWDDAPDLLITAETSATLVNLTMLPYRGTGYDRVMTATYRAMNELSMNHIDRARVELNRALVRQEEAAAFARRQVDTAKAEASEANRQGDKGVNASRSASDPATQSKLGPIYGDLKSYRIYGDYVNPYSVWLHGIFFLATAEGNSDIERAHKSLERLHLLVPGCTAATADYELAKKLRDGGALPPTVWVVFETGMGPHRREERVDLPVYIVSSTVPYAGVALPKLTFNSGHTASLAVEVDGKVVARTQSVASMDAIVATDFDNEKDIIVTRSLITAGLKVAAQYVVNQAAKRVYEQQQNSAGTLLYLGSMIATGVATYATTEADLRTWRSLPKDWQIVRLPRPADGKLRLVGATPAQSAEITLPPGTAHLVFAKATGSSTPITHSVTTLKK